MSNTKKLLAPSQKERNGAAGKKSLKNLFLIGKMMQIGNIFFVEHSSSQVLSNQKKMICYLICKIKDQLFTPSTHKKT